MTKNLIGKLCAAGAATAALGLSPLATAASTVTCVPLSSTEAPLCSTDNSKNNDGSIDSSPTQTATSSATGGSSTSSGNGGGALSLNDQTQTTTNVIGQGIDSGNASHSFNGNGTGEHRVVVGGRSFAASGNGGGSFVSLGVGGASNTGGADLAP